MDTRLRGLSPRLAGGKIGRRDNTLLFWLGAAAVILQMTLPSNVLSANGLTALSKVSPATFLVIFGSIYAMERGIVPLSQRLRRAPGLMLFIFGIPLLIGYSTCVSGLSGSTVFVETFWSAGLLAFLLEPASDRHKRILGYILLVLVIVNVFIAIRESVTQTELFPLSYDDTVTQLPKSEIVQDFRAHALYSHPLTASLITAMAFFLLYTMRIRFIFAAPIFALLLIGLLAFGGRTALGVTVIVSAALTLYTLFAGIIRRNLRAGFVLSVVAAVIAIPILVSVIATQTTIADRIIDNLYYDGSAQARATQWEVFRHLNLQDWLFGISKDRLAFLKYQIELGGKDTDIENFWILICLDLGVLGFTAFVALFISFLAHLGRYANTLNGWLLVGTTLIIDSSSNSLGVWSNDLVIEVAFLMAISGFRDYVPVRSAPRIAQILGTRRRLDDRVAGLTLIPRPFRTPNLTTGVASHRPSTPFRS